MVDINTARKSQAAVAPGPDWADIRHCCSPELAERLLGIYPSRLTPDTATWSDADALALAKAIEARDEEALGEISARIQSLIDAEVAPSSMGADVTGTDTPFPAADVADNEPLPSDDELREEMLRAALDYAAKGKPVFPANPANKRPLTDNGFKDASCNEAVIREWWTRFHAPRSGCRPARPPASSSSILTARTMWTAINLMRHLVWTNLTRREHSRPAVARTSISNGVRN